MQLRLLHEQAQENGERFWFSDKFSGCSLSSTSGAQGWPRCAWVVGIASLLISLTSTSVYAATGDVDDDGIRDTVEVVSDRNNDGSPDGPYIARPIFEEDFGTGIFRAESSYTSYSFEPTSTIQDGKYAVAIPHSSNGPWMTYNGNISADHTGGDIDGRAFSVNAVSAQNEILRLPISGLTSGAIYQVSAWLIDSYSKVGSVQPNVRFEIQNLNQIALAWFDFPVDLENTWTESSFIYKSVDGANVDLVILNNAPAGAGNDFLLDDISVSILYPDADADSVPDFEDKDSDGDGIPDVLEGDGDKDEDGVPNYLDGDADNDTIPDAIETALSGNDIDNDGIDDTYDVHTTGGIDANFDGIADFSVFPDYDGDGVPDYLDLDSDNDGIYDTLETNGSKGTLDTDGDGAPNHLDLDADGDHIADWLEAGPVAWIDVDSDNDGIADHLDPVSSTPNLGAALPDSGSGSGLTDADSDGDGVPDNFEGALDSDEDGIANYRDLDSDNDGIPDSVEAGEDPLSPIDSDSDGVVDMFDLDSDNDGLTDTFEAGDDDFDGNGVLDTVFDINEDGLDDFTATNPLTLNDTDKDGFLDHLDLDADNDGLSDVFESSGRIYDVNGDGFLDDLTDANVNGLADNVVVNTTLDLDNDGIPNHLDLDSDGDGLTDLSEAGGADLDNDGIVDAWAGSDADLSGSGFVAYTVDGAAVSTNDLPDLDGNRIPDVLELGAAVSVPQIHTGLRGIGCSVAGVSSSRDPLMPSLLLIALSLLWVRRRDSVKTQ